MYFVEKVLYFLIIVGIIVDGFILYNNRDTEVPQEVVTKQAPCPRNFACPTCLPAEVECMPEIIEYPYPVYEECESCAICEPEIVIDDSQYRNLLKASCSDLYTICMKEKRLCDYANSCQRL